MRLLSLGRCVSGQSQGSVWKIQNRGLALVLDSWDTFKSLAHVTHLETLSLADLKSIEKAQVE